MNEQIVKEQFGLRLQNLCDKHDYNYKDISKMLGFSENVFGQYVRGERLPNYLVLIKISDIFQVPLGYLIRGEDPYQEYTNQLAHIFKRAGIENQAISKIEAWQSLSNEGVKDMSKYFDWLISNYKN